MKDRTLAALMRRFPTLTVWTARGNQYTGIGKGSDRVVVQCTDGIWTGCRTLGGIYDVTHSHHPTAIAAADALRRQVQRHIRAMQRAIGDAK